MRKTLGKIALIVVMVFVAVIAVQPAEAATIKAGASCSKLNKVSQVKFAPYRYKTFKCQKKGKKKVWVLKSTTPVLGASGNPVPLNVPIKLGQFTYTITGYEDDRSDVICAENMFNTGCLMDHTVDPAATGRWTRIAVRVKNSGVDDEPSIMKTGIVTGKTMTWSSWSDSFPVAPDRLDDRLILNGQQDVGYLYSYVTKGKAPTGFVIDTSYWTADTFFAIR